MAEIRAVDVGVSFPIYDTTSRSLRNRLMSATVGGAIKAVAGRAATVDALTDLTFDIEHGDRVALIGHNGAGKTTLLRVLAGIYVPTRGAVRVEGRVAPLFDAGFGMDPDSTGYENIRLRALYLGLTKRELEANFDEIAAFTELGSFLDMPLRTYSLGMQTRLAFAVSTSINPEVLLLDEQVGAGDAAFMEKAAARLKDLVERSGILVLASHSSEAVTRFCNKGIVLERGRLQFYGLANEALDFYAAARGQHSAPVA